MKYLLFLPILFFVLLGCNSSKFANGHTINKKPKNVILMIGDGMGLSQITGGMYMNNNKLNLEQFPIVGLHKNYPADKDLITDSAAGATAFSCGCKTYNAAIGMNKDTVPCKTILEYAEGRGMPTGLVATCTIEHATPASFIAHSKKRDEFENIATYFLKTEVDLFIGGGKKYFDQRKSDTRNLCEELEAKGYLVSGDFKDELKNLTQTTQNLAYFTANEHPVPVAQGRDYLPFASKFAMDFLQKRANGKGFFAMIEGSQIDWGGHAGKTDYITSEMIDFDKAVGEVLEFAKKDGNTLVIVTADHETGGFAVLKGSKMNNIVGGFGDVMDEKTKNWYHTATMIPVFAFGPGAEHFAGIYENTSIFDKMKALLGF
jgi:alkaline phosphatase